MKKKHHPLCEINIAYGKCDCGAEGHQETGEKETCQCPVPQTAGSLTCIRCGRWPASPEKDYSHSHCFVNQKGHEKHLRCCLCYASPQKKHKDWCIFLKNWTDCNCGVASPETAQKDLASCCKKCIDRENCSGTERDEYSCRCHFPAPIVTTGGWQSDFHYKFALSHLNYDEQQEIVLFITNLLTKEREKAYNLGYAEAPITKDYELGAQQERDRLKKMVEGMYKNSADTMWSRGYDEAIHDVLVSLLRD